MYLTVIIVLRFANCSFQFVVFIVIKPWTRKHFISFSLIIVIFNTIIFMKWNLRVCIVKYLGRVCIVKYLNTYFLHLFTNIYAVVSCKCTALLLLLQNHFRCFEIKNFTYFEFWFSHVNLFRFENSPVWKKLMCYGSCTFHHHQLLLSYIANNTIEIYMQEI